jgi:hypothetical protein
MKCVIADFSSTTPISTTSGDPHSSHDHAITEQALVHHRAWAWREIFKFNRRTGFDKFRSELTEHVVQRF